MGSLISAPFSLYRLKSLKLAMFVDLHFDIKIVLFRSSLLNNCTLCRIWLHLEQLEYSGRKHTDQVLKLKDTSAPWRQGWHPPILPIAAAHAGFSSLNSRPSSSYRLMLLTRHPPVLVTPCPHFDLKANSSCHGITI